MDKEYDHNDYHNCSGYPKGWALCKVCHLHWDINWLDGGTCIECLEIAEHGISMSEELIFADIERNF
jgi:hypothetical protein